MHHILDDKPEIEFIAGRPYRKVSPKRIHSMVQAAALRMLERCAEDRGAVGPEWRFHLTRDTTLVPDVAFVAYERLQVLSDEEADEPPFAPDIAVEVRSPSHRAALLEEKIQQYIAHGAQLVLDVDPKERVVHAHGAGGVRTYRSGEQFACEEFSWLTFEVSELFARIAIPR